MTSQGCLQVSEHVCKITTCSIIWSKFSSTRLVSTQTSAGDRVEALAEADHTTMAAVLQPSTPEQFMAETELFSINEKYGASSAVGRKRN